MIQSLLPIDVSTFGGGVDHVFWLIFWIVGFWFVLAQGVLAYALIRYRARSGGRARFLRGERAREAAWVFVPALIVLFLDLAIDHAGAAVWRQVKLDLPASDLNIRISAKQFNWGFTYPGPDGKFGTADDFAVNNDLRVPVGKVVRFELRSQDVVHSLFVPALRLKQDAVPGRVIRGWFEATRTGTYEIACTELCGFGHYTMRGTVIVESASDYAAWVAATWLAKTPAASAAAPR